jgi:glycogen synthase
LLSNATCAATAWEIQTDPGGWGLAPTIRNDPGKISGIVNGIDFTEWWGLYKLNSVDP